MTVDEAIGKLWRHAGLAEPAAGGAADLALLLWEVGEGRGLGDVEGAVEEIVGCLQVLNPVLNGLPWGEAEAGDALMRRVVYAMSQIGLECLEAALETGDEAMRGRLVRAAWMVQSAWDAVVAGDSEDVVEEVRREREMRGW